jgi:hypothetical protein
MNFPSFSIEGILIALFGIVFFAVIVREIVAWYWKINDVLEVLDRIEQNTRKK